MKLFGQPVRQIAYVVDDVEAAAARHVATFGSGPFFVSDMDYECVHRGRPSRLAGRAGFGQWGSMQVELLESRYDGPNLLNELYPTGSGKTGFHHLAIIIDDLESTVRHLAEHGFNEATRVPIPQMDLTAVFVDALDRLGHFIELYRSAPALTGFYDAVAAAHVGFDGKNPVRSINALGG